MMNSVSSRRDTLWQNSVQSKHFPTERKKYANDTVYDRPPDVLRKIYTKTTGGIPKRKTLRSNSNVPKTTKFLKSHELDATKSLLNHQRTIKDFKEKLDKIIMFPKEKKELERILEDKEQVNILVKKLTNWLSCNNSKFLELLSVFQNKNQNNCIDYTQFIGTMISLQSPFRMLDLCALVIHLSSQHAGLISEEDIKKVPQPEDPIKCYKCGLGKGKTQSMKGPFGIVQMQLNLPERWVATDLHAQTDNRWVKFLAKSLINKPKPLELDISSSERNTRFKNALMAVCKEKQATDKSNKNKSTEGENVLQNIMKTVRTRGLLTDWRKKVITTKDEVGEELTTGHQQPSTHLERGRLQKVGRNVGSSSEEDETVSPVRKMIGENRRGISNQRLNLARAFTRSGIPATQEPKKDRKLSRFKAATAKLTGKLKGNQPPLLTNVVERTAQKLQAKRHANQPNDNQRHFLKIPKLDASILRALAEMQTAPIELYILLQLRSIVYDSIVSCPAHFFLLLTDNSTLTYISHHIKSVNNISAADVYISPYRHAFCQSLLPLENTLKQCGFKGYCKSHPHKITLYYDFEITYNFTAM